MFILILNYNILLDSLHFVKFLAEAFQCQVDHYQCLVVPGLSSNENGAHVTEKLCWKHNWVNILHSEVNLIILLKIKIYKTVILPVVLYGCETWSLTLREKCRLRVFQNRILRRISGPKRDENGEWRRFHNGEFHNLHHSLVRVIKSRRLIARMESQCSLMFQNVFQVSVTVMSLGIYSSRHTWTLNWNQGVQKRKYEHNLSRCGPTLLNQGRYEDTYLSIPNT